jgi:transcription elongation factor GreA
MEDDNEEEVYTLVTNIRVNALAGLISTDSPVGRAILGKKIGDKVEIKVNDNYSYFAVIKEIKKGEDTDSIHLKAY